jgi:tRNA (guanine-N7-)-methyltransferase
MGQRLEKQEIRSYGRRRGRVFSARQKMLLRDVLPAVAIPAEPGAAGDAAALFGKPIRDIWLEIGFGGGEHLVWQAAHNADVGFIGCEPFENGIVKVLSEISVHSIENVRLYMGDARDLLRQLPSASLGRVFILFPDPWPKRRHQKRRLVSLATLNEIARTMRSNAELRIATDLGEHARWILHTVRRQSRLRWTADGPAQWRRPPPDWHATRYEYKALTAGRRCYYFTFLRS